MGIRYGRVLHSPTTLACASTVSASASVPSIGRDTRSAMRKEQEVLMTRLYGSEEGLGDDDDVAGLQRDVRIRPGVALDGVDVHAQPLLRAPGRSVAAAHLADEGDARGRGELAKASRHRDQLHE